MQLNLKQPKYVLPLIALPFICLFFYVFHHGKPANDTVSLKKDGLNSSVGNVATDVQKRDLSSKLDAFRNTYKDGSGESAVAVIPSETSSNPAYINHGTIDQATIERARLDSINKSIRQRSIKSYATPTPEDQLLAKAIANAKHPHPVNNNANAPGLSNADPMDLFKKQMAYMDSIAKENDPAYKTEKLKKQKADELTKAKESEVSFVVTKATSADEGFNTIRPGSDQDFIKAIIDENETSYAGSRLRLRLLEDIRTAGFLIPKGTYLYALVSGFSQQRVTLSITSIMAGGKIFPVKLSVYDLDGLPGLYVPESAFRDFTKDLSGNSIQGVSIDGGSSGSQFLMSSVDRVFQSTSSAITEIIRKNKAKMKYGTYIYLIDPQALQTEQKSY